MEFIILHKFEIAAALLLISEALGENKKIAQSSIYGVIVAALKKVLGK